MNAVEKAVRKLDGVQQDHAPVALTVAVVKKYGDDRGNQLAALLTYYGFLAIFPALLVMMTILGFIGNEKVSKTVLGQTLRQFPVVGGQIGAEAAHPLHGSGLALVLGLLGLLYGLLGVAGVAQHAMSQVWNVPGVDRPGYLPRLGRSLLFFLVLLVGVVGGSWLASQVLRLGHGEPVLAGFVVVELATSILTYLVAMRVLTPSEIPWRKLVAGAVIGGVGWTILLATGTQLVRHQLRHAEELYGTFGLVLGLLAWLNLAARITLYAAETNVVLERRLWPRAIVQPPLTAADRKVLVDIAGQEARRPEEDVEVRFSAPDGGQ